MASVGGAGPTAGGLHAACAPTHRSLFTSSSCALFPPPPPPRSVVEIDPAAWVIKLSTRSTDLNDEAKWEKAYLADRDE